MVPEFHGRELRVQGGRDSDDLKQGSFLKRIFRVTEDGWE